MKTIRTLLICLFVATLSLAATAEPVNINTEDAATLAESINGVGPKLAAAIVQYRKEYGPFRSVDELQHIKGIGPTTVEKNRANLTVKDPN